jgi:hypothetical protein
MENVEFANYEKLLSLNFFQLLSKNWKAHLLTYFLTTFLMIGVMNVFMLWTIQLSVGAIVISSLVIGLLTVAFFVATEKSLLIDPSKFCFPEFKTQKMKRDVMMYGKLFHVRVSKQEESMCEYYTVTSIYYILRSFVNVVRYLAIFLTFIFVMPPLVTMVCIFYKFRHSMGLNGTGITDFPTNAKALEFYVNNFTMDHAGLVILFVIALAYSLKIAIFSNKDIYNEMVDDLLFCTFVKGHYAESAKNLKFSEVNYPDEKL